MNATLSVVRTGTSSPIFRRIQVAVALVLGVVVVSGALGCSSNRCHRHHCQKRAKCQRPTCYSNQGNTAKVGESSLATEENGSNTTTNPVTTIPSVIQKKGTGPLYGHDENYEHLFGVLQRVHVPRKGWKIRYAPIDQEDRWGGSVVPAPDVRLDSFEDGDNIFVEGEIIGERASLYLSGPRYRISTVRAVNENDFQRANVR